MPRLQPITLLWFAIAATVLLSDQYSKLWIMERYAYGEGEFITSFFNLVRAHNYGAAFSFLSDAGGWQRWAFSLLAAVISVVIALWIARLPVQRKLEGLALALILGGALGNLYDRLTLGYVVDFLDFHWSASHFPAFNIADSGISVGAVLLILDGFINKIDGYLKENQITNYDIPIELFINKIKKSGGSAHILGLASDGGVHSSIDHLLATMTIMSKHDIPILIHVLTDGRDVAPKSAEKYINKLLI